MIYYLIVPILFLTRFRLFKEFTLKKYTYALQFFSVRETEIFMEVYKIFKGRQVWEFTFLAPNHLTYMDYTKYSEESC